MKICFWFILLQSFRKFKLKSYINNLLDAMLGKIGWEIGLIFLNNFPKADRWKPSEKCKMLKNVKSKEFHIKRALLPSTYFPYFLWTVPFYASKMLFNTFWCMLMFFMFLVLWRCNPQRIHNTKLFFPVSCCFCLAACLLVNFRGARQTEQFSSWLRISHFKLFSVFTCFL